MILFAACGIVVTNPAAAEIKSQGDTGFVVGHTAEFLAKPDEVWKRLIVPKEYWNPAHSWSGSVAGFYLDAQSLYGVADRITASIRPGGTVAACHWRRPIEACEFNGDQVHQILLNQLLKKQTWTLLCHVQEPDMVLDVWSLESLSVAQREGFA